LDLHLYLGLLCAPYLIVYGISAISFNHDWVGTPRTSEREVVAANLGSAAGESDAERADAIQQALGLNGWIPARSVRTLPGGEFHFVVNRPGRAYRVKWSEADRSAHIEETHKGLLDVFRGLHGMRDLPGTRIGAVWGLYTELSVWVLVFAVGSGIYLWSSRSDVLGWALLGSGSLAFLALSVAVW
jgi:hypothetical protein